MSLSDLFLTTSNFLKNFDEIDYLEKVHEDLGLCDKIKALYHKLLDGKEITEEDIQLYERVCKYLEESNYAKLMAEYLKKRRPHYEVCIINGEESLVLFQLDLKE